MRCPHRSIKNAGSLVHLGDRNNICGIAVIRSHRHIQLAGCLGIQVFRTGVAGIGIHRDRRPLNGEDGGKCLRKLPGFAMGDLVDIEPFLIQRRSIIQDIHPLLQLIQHFLIGGRCGQHLKTIHTGKTHGPRSFRTIR